MLAFAANAEEVFVDAPEGVVVQRGGNLGDFLEQFLEKGAGEEVEGLGQDAGELWRSAPAPRPSPTGEGGAKRRVRVFPT
jgi:hypothetical protein